MMDFEEIKEYWENRSAIDSSAQSTTQDYYLREIEYSALFERIQKYSPGTVADIGCGDGRTTTRLASKLQNVSFFGFDYAPSMVKNAQSVKSPIGISNIKFDQLDICKELRIPFDLIYTTRCLINLPSWDLQMVALKNIYDALNVGGVYLMVENFIEGHNNFNQIRKNYGLPEIPIREHNLFFERQRLLEFFDGLYKVEEEVNISSLYYLVSRVVYSKICAETGTDIEYFDDHHRLAVGLPFCGEFGPVRLICLKKE